MWLVVVVAAAVAVSVVVVVLVSAAELARFMRSRSSTCRRLSPASPKRLLLIVRLGFCSRTKDERIAGGQSGA
jgi:hypothetical protein